MQIGSQKSSPEFCPTTGGLCAVHVFLAPASTINTSYWFSTRSLWTARNFVSVSSANSSAAVPAEVLHSSLRTQFHYWRISEDSRANRSKKITASIWAVAAIQASLFLALKRAENIASRAPFPGSNLTWALWYRPSAEIHGNTWAVLKTKWPFHFLFRKTGKTFRDTFVTTIFAFAHVSGHYHLSWEFRGESGLSTYGFEKKTCGWTFTEPTPQPFCVSLSILKDMNKNQWLRLEWANTWRRDLDLSQSLHASFAALSQMFAINSQIWQNRIVYIHAMLDKNRPKGGERYILLSTQPLTGNTMQKAKPVALEHCALLHNMFYTQCRILMDTTSQVVCKRGHLSIYHPSIDPNLILRCRAVHCIILWVYIQYTSIRISFRGPFANQACFRHLSRPWFWQGFYFRQSNPD